MFEVVWCCYDAVVMNFERADVCPPPDVVRLAAAPPAAVRLFGWAAVFVVADEPPSIELRFLRRLLADWLELFTIITLPLFRALRWVDV